MTRTHTDTGLKLKLSVAPSVSSRRWEPAKLSWDALVDKAHHPESVKDCGGYVAGVLRGTSRRKGQVESRTAVTLDADSASDHLPSRVSELGVKALVHSTYSHTADHPRYRVIIPILGPGLTEDEYPRVARGLMSALGEAQFDPGSTQPERLMFWPSTGHPEDYEVYELDGETATRDFLLREYGGLGPTPDAKPGVKRDPKDLPGVPGAFNRVYDMASAVEEFNLPYDPVPGDPDRWHYSPAESEGGVLVYPDGYVFSNHASDPAYGKALSVFDLVALHVYGSEDSLAGIPDSTPPADRPSVKRAIDAFSSRPEIVTELVGSDFTGDEDAIPEWCLGLHLHPKTGKPLDDVHNWDLLSGNDPILTGLARNSLEQNTVSRRDFPWRKITPGLDDSLTAADRAEISAHLQRTYSFPRPSMDQLNGVIESIAQRNSFNPVEDYLAGLSWDGVSRVEHCLPGVEESDYTRRIARLVTVQAVARVLDPGVKIDNCLILVGGQGLGKTWWMDHMSKGWTAQLGHIGDKDTIMSMMRSWIVVADEGFAMKKADNDALKEFITRTHDVVRLPYARETVRMPRRQVIWGTTNDPVFLRSQDGNRRYLVVNVEHKIDFEKFTDEYIDQVWAEAVHLYQMGDPLFLSDSESAMADEVRAASTEEDSLLGLIRAYLEMTVPDNWDDLSTEERQIWVSDYNTGNANGTNTIDSVCSLEVWELVLGNRRGDHNRSDILKITSALKRIPGWQGPTALPVRTRLYGPQRVFYRENTSINNTQPSDPMSLI